MNKKVVSALLFGSLVFATGTFTACSDYDEDIDSLNERVDAVEKSIAGLQASIEAGNVITNVESTDNGVKVTLSDGTSFELTNGKDGAAGAPGSVVTIGDNGNWFIDGVDTGKPSRGEKGEQGEQGVQGPQGEQGIQGEQGPQGEQGIQGEQGESGDYAGKGNPGDYYYPAEDGLWHKYVYDAATGKYADSGETAGAWKSAEGGVTAVYDTTTGLLTLANVVVDGVINQTVTIEMYAELKSLAVIPSQLDKETNYPLAFFYNIMGWEGNQEGSVGLSVATSTNAQAHYRLNPANANIQDWNWSMIDRVVTRAEGDKSELLSVIAAERANDELIVTLKSNQSLEDLATGTDNSGNTFKEHAIAALQGTNKNTDEVITSDYIKVTSKDLTQFSVITGYDMAESPIKVFELPKAGEEDFDPTYVNRIPDAKLVYTESLDLSTLVKTWAKEVQGFTTPNIPVMVDDMVNEGELTYEFTLPAEYELGGNKTNQQDFVTLDGSVLTVNSAKYPNGTAAIGRTPIVWIRTIVNGKTIASGVIKVAVVKEDAKEQPAVVVSAVPVNMEYSDIVNRNTFVNKFTWEDMSQVYDALNITRDEFIEHYGTNYEITNEDDEVAFGGVIDGVALYNWSDQAVSTTTNAIEMYLIPDQIASDAEGTIKITYTPDDIYTYAPVVVEFPYVIKHTHQFFPDFNPQYVENEIAVVKGIMQGGNWVQSVEISEHFTGLANYVPEGNHNYPHLEIEPDAQRIVRLNLTGTTLGNQVLTLESPVIGEYVDVPVRVVETLYNGEDICVKTYTIRFVNPFKASFADVNLEAPLPGRTDSEGIALTIKDVENDNIIATITGTAIGMDVDVTASNAYGVTAGDIQVDLTEGENWAEKFGRNNDWTQKLALDPVTGMIKWENKGTALVTPVSSTYDAQVQIGNFCIMNVKGNVKVTETNVPVVE